MLILGAALILVIVYIFDRERLQFDVTAFKAFLKILFIGSAISVVLNTLLGRIPPQPFSDFSSLLFVWWEDILFILLPLFYGKKYLPHWAFVIVAVLTSAVFGLGHLYQGWLAAVLLSAYPYFISYHYGKKHGFGTVMVAHVVFDIVILGNIHIMKYLALAF